MQLRGWWHGVAPALALAAVVLPLAARAVAGPPGAAVHVRWRAALTLLDRQRLETRYGLADGVHIEGETWNYDLLDPSRENIQALVNEPAVQDTAGIDRPRAVLEPATARTTRRSRLGAWGDLAVAVSDRLAILFAAAAIAFRARRTTFGGWVARSTRQGVSTAAVISHQTAQRLSASAVARSLTRGVPSLDARTAAAFRIGFGICVVCFFVSRPVDAARLEMIFNPQVDSDLQAGLLQWLRGHPAIANMLTPWLILTGAAFIVGVLTRWSFALFVLGAVVWAFAAVAFDSTHPHSTLLVTLVALLPSRWGDAWSVDAAWGRTRARVAGRSYGYTVWVPGLVFGVAFAAAAWAKLAASGVAWVLNGTVKYHFIADAANAPLDWGLQLAAHPGLAIVASLFALATEALVLTAAFVRSEAYRLLLGGAALAMLGGFRLFMGVFWPGWWILLLAFLPWQAIADALPRAPSPSPGSTAPVTITQLAALAFVIAQQVVVSALAIEHAPMFSYYPMYSDTYASPAAYDASVRSVYRLSVTTAVGRVELSCNASAALVADFRSGIDGARDAADRVWHAVHACRPDLENAHDVTLFEERRAFDWQRLTFSVQRSTTLGTLGADRSSSARNSSATDRTDLAQ